MTVDEAMVALAARGYESRVRTTDPPGWFLASAWSGNGWSTGRGPDAMSALREAAEGIADDLPLDMASDVMAVFA